MKTTISVYAAFFFISVSSISCHKDSDVLGGTFSKVEEYMDICPDTALYILNSIPNPEDLRGKAGADYALLMTQAMDKNYMKFSSDSLIALALNYYSVDKREPDMRAKAQYYYGRVLLESDKAEEALGYFLAAKEYFESVRNYKILALIAEETGKISRKQKKHAEALADFRGAFAMHQQLKDSMGIVRTSLHMARSFLFENQWDSSHYYYNYALKLTELKKYPFENSILHELGILYRSMGDLNAAEPYFLSAYQKESDEEKKYMECLSLGYLYMQMGRVQEAKKYLKMSMNSPHAYTRINAYTYLYFLEKDIDSFEKAVIYHEKADSITNAMEAINSEKLITQLQKQYEKEKLQNNNLRMKIQYTSFTLWSVVAFLLVAFCMCYYYRKNREHKSKIVEIESQIRDNEEEIDRYQQEVEEIQKLKDLLQEENRSKVGELNGKIVLLAMQNKNLSGLLKELGGELAVGASSEQYISAFRLLLAIKEGTLRGKLSNEEREKLFSLFDLLYSNYVSRLLELCPSLTRHDLEICCFLKFGLTHEELSRIFQTSPDSVTKAKGRLKGRLGVSPQEDLVLYLSEF
ncbi:hypothetical protein [Bacteroides sp. GM023]|uniref:tetratricopeptide repeat protein n=1 Tax=Bacteroides sp. GM023 TaxID=2723058 RepID=UPI00351CB664